jgi:hypothetical protein
LGRQPLADGVYSLVQLLVRRYPVLTPQLLIRVLPDFDLAAFADKDGIEFRAGERVYRLDFTTRHDAHDHGKNDEEPFHIVPGADFRHWFR